MTLHPIDWIVLIVYLSASFSIAVSTRIGQKSSSDFFLAGKSVHWIIVALSIFATLFSSISFIGVPGEAYKNGITALGRSWLYAFFTPLAVWLFLRFFFSSNQMFSAYEYLERRFDVRSRTIGSLVFIVSRALYGAAVFYATALLFHQLTGWSPYLVVFLIGLFAVTYTAIGGLRAIMFMDAIQTLIILAGVFAILYKGSALIGFDYGGLWTYVSEHGRGLNEIATQRFYSFDPKVRLTFWIVLAISLIEPLQHYGTDQLVVQRLLASKDYRSASKSIYLKTVIAPVVMSLFFLIGLIMFYYYGKFAELPPDVTPDRVVSYFMLTQMPSPLPGLLAAALLAALMSTIDSTVGALSTVFCVDFLKRFHWIDGEDRTMLLWGKILTWVWGAVLIGGGMGLVYLSQTREHLMVFELVAVWNSLWAVLVVVMLAGVCSTFFTPNAAFIALLSGTTVNLIFPWHMYFFTPPQDQISPFLIPFPGMLLTFLLVVIVSAFDQKNRKNVPDLTLGGKHIDKKITDTEYQ